MEGEKWGCLQTSSFLFPWQPFIVMHCSYASPKIITSKGRTLSFFIYGGKMGTDDAMHQDCSQSIPVERRVD